LLSNRNYKIGRKNPTETKNADIEVGDDPSVSRVHAEILIKFDEKICDDISQQANIVLTDHSKFGTFVNDVKVETFKALKINDIIKFGVSTYYKYSALILNS
jgi:pSer/pThr/pTyr-binding forkhead associated (FHA) protein